MKKSLMAVLCVVYLAISAPLWVKDHASSVGAYRYRSIYVIDDSTGWMVGENHMVRKRTDGVHSHDWEDKSSTLPQGYLNYHFNDVFFINADTGWIVGEYKHDTINYSLYITYNFIGYSAESFLYLFKGCYCVVVVLLSIFVCVPCLFCVISI